MSVLDRTIGDGLKQGAFKVIPKGKYVLQVVDLAVRKGGDKDLAELKLQIIAPLEDQDLTGINTDKARARGTLWLTDAAFGFTTRTLRKMNADIPEQAALRDALELVLGSQFVGVLEHRERKNSDKVDVELDTRQVFSIASLNTAAAAA